MWKTTAYPRCHFCSFGVLNFCASVFLLPRLNFISYTSVFSDNTDWLKNFENIFCGNKMLQINRAQFADKILGFPQRCSVSFNHWCNLMCWSCCTDRGESAKQNQTKQMWSFLDKLTKQNQTKSKTTVNSNTFPCPLFCRFRKKIIIRWNPNTFFFHILNGSTGSLAQAAIWKRG